MRHSCIQPRGHKRNGFTQRRSRERSGGEPLPLLLDISRNSHNLGSGVAPRLATLFSLRAIHLQDCLGLGLT